MSAKQKPEITQHADVVANAAAEASKPGVDTESQYECPFCVMMRKGGCEEVFKAFMECGEKADKGDSEMADCLPQFEQLHLCMEKNKAVFDSLLQEMKDEEEANKAAAASSSDGAGSAAAATQQGGSDAAVAAGVTTHQQQQHSAAGSVQAGSGARAGPDTVSVAAGSSMAAAS